MRKTDEEFVNTPDEWPAWPWLPVVKKNYEKEESYPACGLVHASNTKQVIEGSMYTLASFTAEERTKALKEATRYHYDSVEKMLAEWRID